MKRTRTKLLTLASALVALVATPATARQPDSPREGARGGFQMTVHSHSSQTGGPGSAQTPLLLPETDPLEAPPPEGTSDFSYSAIPCRFPAPFNDQALNFNPNPYPIPDPAPVRFIVKGKVTDGETGTVEGTILTILCTPPTAPIEERTESEHTFVTAFQGRYRVVSDNEARFTGTYEIVDGTGMFEDLTGHGSIKGSFICLPPILQRTGEANCEDLGFYSDFIAARGDVTDPPDRIQPGLVGTFADPTVPS